MLKSPKTFSQVEEGGWQPAFDAESKNPKIPNSHFCRGVGSQLLMLSPKMLKSQIHIFTGVGRERVSSQLLMLSPKILKSQIHIFRGGGRSWWPTFDAESKNAKKSQLHIFTGARGGLTANF